MTVETPTLRAPGNSQTTWSSRSSRPDGKSKAFEVNMQIAILNGPYVHIYIIYISLSTYVLMYYCFNDLIIYLYIYICIYTIFKYISSNIISSNHQINRENHLRFYHFDLPTMPKERQVRWPKIGTWSAMGNYWEVEKCLRRIAIYGTIPWVPIYVGSNVNRRLLLSIILLSSFVCIYIYCYLHKYQSTFEKKTHLKNNRKHCIHMKKKTL